MTDIQIVTKGQEPEDKGLEDHLKEENVREHAKRARDLFQGIHDELNNKEDFRDGLSFLDMKNDTLLSYMIDLCNIVLKKIRGESIEGHPSVERCIEYRVILEKIKAIDLRLAYQLNKLIAMPENATEEDQKIDINNLDINIESGGDDNSDEDNDDQINNDEEEDEENDDDEDDDDEEPDDDEDDEGEDALNESSDDGGVQERDSKPVGVYKPPKLRSVAYNDGKESQARRKDYSDFYRDDDGDDMIDQSHPREDKEKTRFEEDNYTRVRDNPKKTKRKQGGKAAKKFKGKKKRR